VLLWEVGKQAPTLTHLRELSKFLKRPLAAFFLPAPPQEPPPPGDFRRLPEDKAHPFSLKTILALRRARMIQAAASEFVQDANIQMALPIGTAALADNPATYARNLRGILGITVGEQAAWPGSEAAFRTWKTALEAKGLFIAELSFPFKEARAFSIMDTCAPLVVLNNNDSHTGKVFSLFHEYAHLLLGKSGILDNTSDARLTDEGRQAERFCNAFAAEFLVPTDALANADIVAAHRPNASWTDDEISRLAERFHVSPHVVARRLLTVGRMSESAYRSKSTHYEEQYAALATQKPFGRRVPAKMCIRENGRPFVALVYEAFGNQRITYKDIADCLGTKTKYVDEIARLMRTSKAA
jgi:Zn-dependent peptidase ImmA (M78 family)